MLASGDPWDTFGMPIAFIFTFCILAFYIWMIVDCAKNEDEGNTKIVWILVILLTGCIGAPLYFIVRKLPRKNRNPPQ